MADSTRPASGSSTPGGPTPAPLGGTHGTGGAGSSNAAGSPGAGQQRQAQQAGQRQGQGQGGQGQGGQGQGGQGQGGQGHQHDSASRAGELTGAKAISEAKKVGTELVGAARDSAVSLLDAQRARAADQIAAVGDALRSSAEVLEDKGGASLVRYADQAAEQIEGFADVVRNRSWSELAGDVEGFARRWPMAFMAAAVGIGFIAGRFMLSSSERSDAAAPQREGRTDSAGHLPAAATNPGARTEARALPTGARAGYGSPAAGE